MITLTRSQHLGSVLRRLRHDAGLSLRQLGVRAHISKSGAGKREQQSGMSAAGLIDHAHVLGFDLALIPSRHPGARPTGTGWPA